MVGAVGVLAGAEDQARVEGAIGDDERFDLERGIWGCCGAHRARSLYRLGALSLAFRGRLSIPRSAATEPIPTRDFSLCSKCLAVLVFRGTGW